MRPYTYTADSVEEEGEEVIFSSETRFVLKSRRKLHQNDRFWLPELAAIPEQQQKNSSN